MHAMTVIEYTLSSGSCSAAMEPGLDKRRVAAGDDGDCMYIILRGSCNVHVDPDFDETAQAGALQKASLQPKVVKKKQPVLAAKHLLRPGGSHLDHQSSMAQSLAGASRRTTQTVDGHSRRSTGLGKS